MVGLSTQTPSASQAQVTSLVLVLPSSRPGMRVGGSISWGWCYVLQSNEIKAATVAVKRCSALIWKAAARVKTALCIPPERATALTAPPQIHNHDQTGCRQHLARSTAIYRIVPLSLTSHDIRPHKSTAKLQTPANGSRSALTGLVETPVSTLPDHSADDLPRAQGIARRFRVRRKGNFSTNSSIRPKRTS